MFVSKGKKKETVKVVKTKETISPSMKKGRGKGLHRNKVEKEEKDES